MILKYMRERGYQGEGKDPSFTLGNTYIALSISLNYIDKKPVYVGVQRESDGTPCLVELQFFDVLNPAIPSDWEFFDFKNNHYRLQPKEFGGDFWDEFHDANEAAEIVFLNVLEKLKKFHSLQA